MSPAETFWRGLRLAASSPRRLVSNWRWQSATAIDQIVSEPFRCPVPTASACQVDLPLDSLNAGPGVGGQEIDSLYRCLPTRCWWRSTAACTISWFVLGHGKLLARERACQHGATSADRPAMIIPKRLRAAPSILVGVMLTRSPSCKTWSEATGWRLTRIR